MSEDDPKEPPITLTMKFCRACGRNDLVRPLTAKHYYGGDLCRGVIIDVRYEREVKGGEHE